MNREYVLIISAIIILVIVSITIVLKKLKKKVKKLSVSQSSEIVKALGGSDNIESYEAKVSRLNVFVVDSSLVDSALIKEITASGVSIVNNKVQIIMNNNAPIMEKILNDLRD